MSDSPYTFREKKINESALEQTVFWYDRTGKLYRIDAMHKNHLMGAMNKLFDAFGAKAFISPLFKALQAAAERK